MGVGGGKAVCTRAGSLSHYSWQLIRRGRKGEGGCAKRACEIKAAQDASFSFAGGLLEKLLSAKRVGGRGP